MTKHRDVLYLGHMLDAARSAHARALTTTREQFEADGDLQIVLTHFVRIIGEAARRVSEATKAAHPEIPWTQITGMRHKIVHDYMDVNTDVVWDTVLNDLPDLITHLEAITPPAPPSA